MSGVRRLPLFAGIGVELEYMIVDDTTLDVAPVADELIRSESGTYDSEIERGAIAWSNELALHVVELKTNGPAAGVAGLVEPFQQEIAHITALLRGRGSRLMPGGMHPWMDPERDLRLWPHEYNAVYEAFDRIFDCRGHGWANLQSTHLNLPFATDEEFGRLHAAIRLALPILPALAASSPIVEGESTGLYDTRLAVYRANARRVPSVTGDVVPEPVFTTAAYERDVLGRIYADLAPYDPDGTLRYEWVNARGCIPRFDRGTIEIRVLDVQECPEADLAIAAAVIALLRALVEERWSATRQQRAVPQPALVALLGDVTRAAGEARVTSAEYLASLGYRAGGTPTVTEVWRSLCAATAMEEVDGGRWWAPLEVILDEGCLARRILDALEPDTGPTRENLRAVYRALCDCLRDGRVFRCRG